MKALFQSFRRRQLRRFAKTFSTELKNRFGPKAYYSSAEVEEVASYVGVNEKQREWAYGMFAEEPACQGFLSRIGSSKTAKELRFFLAGQMFAGGTSIGYDSLWNRFDDPDDLVIGGGLGSGTNGSWGGSGDSYGDYSDTGGSDGGSSD